MKKLSVVLITSLFLSSICYADSIDRIEYDRVTNKVRVEGRYDRTDIFRPIFVMKVEDEKKTLNLMMQKEYAEEQGKFYFEIPMDGESGEYTITVNSNVFENALTEKFDFYSGKDLLATIERINNTTSFEEFKNELEQNAVALGINTELNDRISDLDLVYERMYDKKPFGDIKTLLDEHLKDAVTILVYEKNDLVYCVKMLDEYREEIGIVETEAYEDYQNMTEIEKQFLISKISGLKAQDDFEKSFNEGVILTKVKMANSYGEAGKIIKKYSDIVKNEDISRYFIMADTSKIDLELVGQNYNSISELQKDIYKKLDEKKGNNSSGGGGSSGISGNKSGGGLTVMPSNSTISYSGETQYLYNDIESVGWAQNAIYTLSKRGVLNGVGEGKFMPDNNVKREEFVKILVTAFNVETEGVADLSFSDVLPGAWYEKYINAGVNTKAINGIGNNMFGVGKSITRQDLAVMAYRFAKSTGCKFENSASLDSFVDRGAISDYAKEAVQALYSEEIINGMGNSRFEPNQPATRAQAAVIVHRLLDYAEGGQK